MGRTPTVWLGGGAGNNSVTVTASSTANALGAWVEVGTLPYPCDKIKVAVDTTNTSGNPLSLINIGIGPSGSQINIINNIPLLQSLDTNTGTAFFGPYFEFDIPLLPGGTILWVNIQSSVASNAPRISIGVDRIDHGYRNPVSTLGADLSTSGGTSFTLASGAYGAWVSLGTLSFIARKLNIVTTRAVSAVQTVNIGVGASGSQSIVAVNVPTLFSPNPVIQEGFFPPGDYWIQGQGDTETVLGTAIFY